MVTLKFAAVGLLLGVGCIMLPMRSSHLEKPNGIDPMVVRQELVHFGYERESADIGQGFCSERWSQPKHGPGGGAAVLVTFASGKDATFTFFEQ